MNSVALKERINAEIKDLKTPQLELALDYLQTLKNVDVDPTDEIMADEDWSRSVKLGMAQIDSGETVRWEDIR